MIGVLRATFHSSGKLSVLFALSMVWSNKIIGFFLFSYSTSRSQQICLLCQLLQTIVYKPIFSWIYVVWPPRLVLPLLVHITDCKDYMEEWDHLIQSHCVSKLFQIGFQFDCFDDMTNTQSCVTFDRSNQNLLFLKFILIIYCEEKFSCFLETPMQYS